MALQQGYPFPQAPGLPFTYDQPSGGFDASNPFGTSFGGAGTAPSIFTQALTSQATGGAVAAGAVSGTGQPAQSSYITIDETPQAAAAPASPQLAPQNPSGITTTPQNAAQAADSPQPLGDTGSPFAYGSPSFNPAAPGTNPIVAGAAASAAKTATSCGASYQWICDLEDWLTKAAIEVLIGLLALALLVLALYPGAATHVVNQLRPRAT